MEKRRKVQIEQLIEVEKIGETFSIRITLENVRKDTTRKEIISQLNTLYKNVLAARKFIKNL